ncbi:MAG: hypothetical protein ACYCZ1_07355 [Candidatus Humimicrobiaceae bacterium]
MKDGYFNEECTIGKKFKQNEKYKENKSLLITVNQNNKLIENNKIYRNYALDAEY